jgi:predicted RNase H-like nuclease
MPWVAGADGCKRGWLRALRETDTGILHFDVVDDARGLLRSEPRPIVLAIDIPIGLTHAGPRDCDRMARERLGWPRRNSVFPAPIRSALAARTREEASRLTQERDGRRVSTQAWAIYAKIRAVDEFLRSNEDAKRRFREVHPEVSFCAWNGHRPIVPGKKTREGRRLRLDLVENWCRTVTVCQARQTRRQSGSRPQAHSRRSA